MTTDFEGLSHSQQYHYLVNSQCKSCGEQHYRLSDRYDICSHCSTIICSGTAKMENFDRHYDHEGPTPLNRFCEGCYMGLLAIEFDTADKTVRVFFNCPCTYRRWLMDKYKYSSEDIEFFEDLGYNPSEKLRFDIKKEDVMKISKFFVDRDVLNYIAEGGDEYTWGQYDE